jgi:polyhydroxyalkanoate synthesis regulator phasin
MAERDLLRRYLDAGVAFTQMTQQRAEAIVRDLVKAGEVQTEQAQAAAQELVDRSRKNTERLVELVRNEIRQQVSNLGLATKADLARLERRIDSAGGSGAAKAARKSSTAKKTAARKTAKRTTKRTAKRTTKKAAAKKAGG